MALIGALMCSRPRLREKSMFAGEPVSNVTIARRVDGGFLQSNGAGDLRGGDVSLPRDGGGNREWDAPARRIVDEYATWDELEAAQRENETAACRAVGLVIETRPDHISEAEVIRVRRLGCTKVQIGFQSLNDRVLEMNKRGHDMAATRRAVKLLRKAGFKIHAHWMPNLYGSSPQDDLDDYEQALRRRGF